MKMQWSPPPKMLSPSIMLQTCPTPVSQWCTFHTPLSLSTTILVVEHWKNWWKMDEKGQKKKTVIWNNFVIQMEFILKQKLWSNARSNQFIFCDKIGFISVHVEWFTKIYLFLCSQEHHELFDISQPWKKWKKFQKFAKKISVRDMSMEPSLKLNFWFALTINIIMHFLVRIKLK